jgi:hypothetical protein
MKEVSIELKVQHIKEIPLDKVRCSSYFQTLCLLGCPTFQTTFFEIIETTSLVVPKRVGSRLLKHHKTNFEKKSFHKNTCPLRHVCCSFICRFRHTGERVRLFHENCFFWGGGGDMFRSKKFIDSMDLTLAWFKAWAITTVLQTLFRYYASSLITLR